jgi:addiction module HigA family antidote
MEEQSFPSWPGKIVYEQYLRKQIVSKQTLYKDLGLSRRGFNRLIKGQLKVDEDLAKKLGTALGTTPDLWLNLQKKVDEFLEKSVAT